MRRHLNALIVTISLWGCGGSADPTAVFIYSGGLDPESFRPFFDLAVSSTGANLRLDIVDETQAPADRAPDLVIAEARDIADRRGIAGVLQIQPSRLALASAPIFEQAGIPNLLILSTSPLLREFGPWTFQLPPDDLRQGSFVACMVARGLTATTASIFYLDSEYGQGVRASAEATFRNMGVDVLAVRPYDDQTDYGVAAEAALLAGRPDVAVVAGYSEDAGRLIHALDRAAPGIVTVISDGVMSSVRDFLTEAGGAAENSWLVSVRAPRADHPLAARFAETFQRVARVDSPVPLSSGLNPLAFDYAQAFDAFHLLATAVGEAGSRPRDIQNYLMSLGRGRPAFQGIVGTFAFGAERQHWYTLVRATPRSGAGEGSYQFLDLDECRAA